MEDGGKRGGEGQVGNTGGNRGVRRAVARGACFGQSVQMGRDAIRSDRAGWGYRGASVLRGGRRCGMLRDQMPSEIKADLVNAAAAGRRNSSRAHGGTIVPPIIAQNIGIPSYPQHVVFGSSTSPLTARPSES